MKNVNGQEEVNLYTMEGFEMLSKLWIKVSAEFTENYKLTWLRGPIIKIRSDIKILQELLWEIKPGLLKRIK